MELGHLALQLLVQPLFPTRLGRKVATMKRIFALTLGCLSALAVDVRTNIPLVYHDGPSELIGNFTLEFRSNDFPNASPQNPVYIRFRMLHGNGWAKSLVDLRPGAPTAINQPINMALFPSVSTGLNPLLQADAVQLVRLIQGEKEGWLRVNRSSNSWAFRNGSATSPAPDISIALALGISGYTSVQPLANTPSNGNEWADGSSVASTELCVNYENTPDFNPGDLEVLDFIAYLADTTGVETAFTVIPGTNAGVTFSDDNQVARGELYVARMEYHLQPGNYDTPPHQLEVTRLDASDLWHLAKAIPPVYITNSSDFAWEPGTTLYLTDVGFSPDFLGTYTPFHPNENIALSSLGDPQLSSSFSAQWKVTPITYMNAFAGYSLQLLQGSHPSKGALQISGLKLSVHKDLPVATLNLAAYARVKNSFVTQGEIVPLGPRIRATGKVTLGQKTLFRTVVPYTAYDHADWTARTQVVNQADQEATVTAFLFNRHGIELRIWSQQHLPAHGASWLDIHAEFGELARSVLAWVEILSDQPLAACTVLEDAYAQKLDIFPAVQNFQNLLMAPHLPSQAQNWKTTGFIVSSNLTQDAEFFVKYPGVENSRIRSIFVPGSTATIQDSDFDNTRPGWYQVSTNQPAGSGILFYDRLTGPGQLASVPMEPMPATLWEFDHLGSVQAGWWNGLVLMNPQPSPAHATLTTFSADFTVLDVVDLEVPAETRLVDLLESWMPSMHQAAPSRLMIQSDQPLLTMLLIGMHNEQLLTTVPGDQALSKTLLLPLISSNPEHWHGIALVNPGDQAAFSRLIPYTATGQAGPETTLALPARGKTVWLLEDLFPTLRSYASMRIVSTRPVRGLVLTGNRQQTQLATIKLVP